PSPTPYFSPPHAPHRDLHSFPTRRSSDLRIMHGKISPIAHRGSDLFEGLPSPLDVTRYHSLIIERDTLPPELEVLAWTDEPGWRSEEHTSELQSRENLVCRLLLEKKNTIK